MLPEPAPLMPLTWLNRFTPTGFRQPREVAEKCNALGDATIASVASIESRLDLLETLIVELRVAAQGAMTLQTPVAGPDITAAFQPITFYDTIPYQRGVTVNTTTGEFTFNLAGDWALFYTMALNHTGSGARRTVDIRAFDVTSAVPGTSETVFIPSNQEDTPFTAVVPLAVVSGDVGDTFRLEIGNASANVTGVTWNTSNLLILFVGELGQLIAP